MLPKMATTHQILETEAEENSSSCEQEDAASNSINRDDESEIIRQLKNKFEETTVRSEKVQVLTVLPKSWSIRGTEEEFGASNYMDRYEKQKIF